MGCAGCRVACTGAVKWLWVSALLIRASRCMRLLVEYANGRCVLSCHAPSACNAAPACVTFTVLYAMVRFRLLGWLQARVHAGGVEWTHPGDLRGFFVSVINQSINQSINQCHIHIHLQRFACLCVMHHTLSLCATLPAHRMRCSLVDAPQGGVYLCALPPTCTRSVT